MVYISYILGYYQWFYTLSSFDIVVHIHEVHYTIHIVRNITIAVDRVLDHTRSYCKIY